MENVQVASRISERTGYLIPASIAAIGYFILASATIVLTSDGRNHAAVWPADAIILALLLHHRRGFWPAILLAGWLGNLLANGVTRGWMVGLILYGAINMAQTALAAALLKRSSAGGHLIEDSRTTARFILVAGIVAPGLGAAAGGLASLVNYGQPFGLSFLRWFASNALGLLILTPFLKSVFDGGYARSYRLKSGTERMIAFGLLIIHFGLTAIVFAQDALPLLFLPICTLLLLAFRLGRLGAKAGVMLVALIGAVAAYRVAGPMMLMHQTPMIQSLFFQAYLGVILCTALPVAATVASREEALSRLAERDEAVRMFMDKSSDAIMSFDSDGICRWAAGRVPEYFGPCPDDMLGRTLDEIGPEMDPGLVATLENSLAAERCDDVFEFAARHNPALILEASFGTWQEPGGHGVVMTVRDISARKAREAAIAKMAEVDDLTGVLNRKGFRAKLAEALADPGRKVSLALIDVDHFKSVNDNFGHSIGDQMLQEIATRLATGAAGSHIVGRLGGDEFAILFELDLNKARKVCEQLAKNIRARPIVDNGGTRITASISCGVAEQLPDMSRGQLFDAADSALYGAKRAGRDGVRAAA